MRRYWFLFLWSIGRAFGDPISEKEYLCQRGEHDWSDVEVHRGKAQYTSPMIITLPDGKPCEIAQVIRKGSRSCRWEGCNKIQKVSQVALLSPVPQEILDKLPMREAKKFRSTKSRWYPQKEEETVP